jgi:hypothetical protein
MFRPMRSSSGVKIIGQGKLLSSVVAYVAYMQVPSMCMCVWVGVLCSLLLCVVLRVLLSNAYKKCNRILQYNIIRKWTLLWAEEKILANIVLRDRPRHSSDG